MTASKLIRMALKSRKISGVEYAAQNNILYQTFRNKLYRDAMSFNDVQKIAESLNYDLVFYDRSNGEILGGGADNEK